MLWKKLTKGGDVKQIAKSGLIGYWHFQQGFTSTTWQNIAPDTKGSYDASVSNATIAADGIYFDGSTARVTIPMTKDLSTITYEIRITPTDFMIDRGILLSNSPSTGTTHSALFFHNGTYNNAQITEYFGRDGSTSTSYATYNPYLDPQMYHLFITYRAGSKDVGTSVNGGGMSYNVLSSQSYNYDYHFEKIYLGGNSSTSLTNNLKGTITLLRIYDRELTSSEILNNFSIGTGVGLS